MNYYEELLKRKENGEIFNFDNITKCQLERLFYTPLSDECICRLYDVSKSEVRKKRYEWNIKFGSSKHSYYKFERENKDIFDDLNKKAKDILLKNININDLSKALTHYVFRNGPVEDIHANGQLSQEDMKVLNKYMVNKFAGLLDLIRNEEWLKIQLMIEFNRIYGKEWDNATYDLEDIDCLCENFILDVISNR